jgi:hypothetical protein
MTAGANSPNSPVRPPAAPWPYSSQRLAEQLVALGVLPAATVSDLIAYATPRGVSLVDAAIERRAISPGRLRDAMSQIFGLAIADLDERDASALGSIPRALALEHFVVPVERDDEKIVLAVADPTRSRTLREIRQTSALPLELRLATADELREIVYRELAPRLSAKLADGTKVDFVIPLGGAKIGRANTNDIILRDPSVSSVHAILQPVEGGGMQITDFGSRNGVVVNRRRLRAPRLLANKDKIQLGKVKMKYRVPEVDMRAGEGGSSTGFFARRFEPRLQAAWISFWGRIIAQTLGAIALIILGLLVSGQMPTSCSSFGAGDDARRNAPSTN